MMFLPDNSVLQKAIDNTYFKTSLLSKFGLDYNLKSHTDQELAKISMTKYHSYPVSALEAKGLQKLEQIFHKPIPEMKWNRSLQDKQVYFEHNKNYVNEFRFSRYIPYRKFDVAIIANHFPYLASLIFNWTRLQELSSSISKLSNLERLDVSHNQLTQLPHIFQSFPKLIILNASHNSLKQASDTLSELKNLFILDLGHNRFRSLNSNFSPPEMLSMLSLDHNLLSYLPSSISKLSVLRRLNLSHNRFRTIPRSITYCKQLHSLDISHNILTEFPTEISKLKKLQTLDLSHNQLTSLPGTINTLENLTSLNISQNNFTNAGSITPIFFNKLPNLTRIITDRPDLIPESLKKNVKLSIIKVKKR